jgi:hypothetical protein
MYNDIKDFENWDVLDILEQGGMTDYQRYPEVYMAWRVAKVTGNRERLNDILRRNPWVLTQAKERIKNCPFLPFPMGTELSEIHGQFNLGIVNLNRGRVGLDLLDFTRGLFICGETGSGKSYPILRLIDQILSIPRNVEA